VNFTQHMSKHEYGAGSRGIGYFVSEHYTRATEEVFAELSCSTALP